MKIRGGSIFVPAIICGILFLGLATTPAVAADKFSRLDKWEFFGFGEYTAEDTVAPYKMAYNALKPFGTFEQEAEAGYGGGFGLGRTIHDHLNLNGTFSYSQVELINRGSRGDSFTLIPHAKTGELSCTSHHWTLNMNVEGYLFKDNFPLTNLKITPVISGGLGTKYIHGQWDKTNLKIRDYILTTNIGVGLRWDFSRFFLKGMYKRTWYRMTDTLATYEMNGGTLAFGCTF